MITKDDFIGEILSISFLKLVETEEEKEF